jgi:signal transduction histidine kinase
VRLEFAPGEHRIQADEDKLSQVFVNLLSNALKYTPSGGAVSVCVIEAGDLIEIRVSDTGIGIAEEDLKNIFERFYRSDKSRSRATGGSGIGLTIARAIVEAHHGSIEVNSEPGKGSEFVVTLPKA